MAAFILKWAACLTGIVLVSSLLAGCMSSLPQQSPGGQGIGGQSGREAGADPDAQDVDLPEIELDEQAEASDHSPEGAPGEFEDGEETGGASIEPGEGEAAEGGAAFGAEVEEADPGRDSVETLLYEDPDFGFSIRYPSTMVILPEEEPADAPVKPLKVIYFQDKEMAESDVADFLPPAFGIRIFDNPANLSAADWLVANERITTAAAKKLTPVVVNSVRGVQHCGEQMIAPNCRVFFSFEKRIYEITPNSEDSTAMLNSLILPLPR